MRSLSILVALVALAACGASHDASAPGATDASGSGDDAGAVSGGATDGATGVGPAGDDAAAGEAGGPVLTGDASTGGFVHPGVLVSGAQLAFVQGRLAAGAEPWTSALAAMKATKYASPTYAPSPVATVECGPYSNPDVGCTAEKDDATAAYTQALLWALTGDQAALQECIAIMNAWSAVLVAHTNSNAPLQSAWVGSVFPRAAEIVAHTSSAWAAADEARFAKMLHDVYLPQVVNGAAKENGNWELSMAEATMAIGVFLDEAATFAKGLALWRGRVPAYVYMASDGPTPVLPPGGAYTSATIAGFWYGQTQLQDGVAQETCRDLGHVQYGFAAMINGAATARVQGVDLFAEERARLVAGLELHAQLLTGAAVPSWLCSGKLNAVTPDPTWEIAYDALATHDAVAMPSTAALIAKIRPTGEDHHMDWETLTSAEVP
jgi:hypothetical protein